MYRLNRCFFFQAEDGIRGAQESRGLGDVYKRQAYGFAQIILVRQEHNPKVVRLGPIEAGALDQHHPCLLYTSDAADDLLCVDLGGRRIIQKQKTLYVILVPTVRPGVISTQPYVQRIPPCHSQLHIDT